MSRPINNFREKVDGVQVSIFGKALLDAKVPGAKETIKHIRHKTLRHKLVDTENQISALEGKLATTLEQEPHRESLLSQLSALYSVRDSLVVDCLDVSATSRKFSSKKRHSTKRSKGRN